MKLTTGRSIKYLLLTHFVFLIFIAIYSFLMIKKPAIQILVNPYLLMSILIIYSKFFLPISAGALFILITLAEKNRALEREKGSGKILVSSIIPVLIPTTLIYIFLVFFAEPMLIAKKEWLGELSKTGEFYLLEAEKNLVEENLEEALAFVNLYLYIDQNNKTAIDIKNNIKIAWPNSAYPKEINEDEIKALSGDSLTGQRVLDIAQKYYEQGDYSSAGYYGQMAGGFKSSREKAAQLVKKSLGKISGLYPNKKPEEKLYDGKIDITKRIGTKDFFGAYYIYHTLSQQFPQDKELSDLGQRLFLLLSENSFFYEDIRIPYFAPGKTEIAFVNKNDSEKEFVFAKKIVFTNDGIYFFDIDIINLSSSGQIERHLKSLYGKVIGNTLNMQCLGKEKKLLLYPEVVVGNKGSRISSIELEIPNEALPYMGIEESRLLKTKTSFLFNNLELLSKAGAGKYAPAKALFIRFIRSFNYIFMLLLVMASGISFFKRRKDISYLSLLMTPAVVAVIYFLEETIIYIKTRILLIFLKETGIYEAALCCALIIAIELVAVIFYTIAKASSIKDYKA